MFDATNYESEFLKTIANAKEHNVSYIWSGDLRSEYLRECLSYAKKNNLVTITEVNLNQESGLRVEWT